MSARRKRGAYGVIEPGRAMLAPPSRPRRIMVMLPCAAVDAAQEAADEALDLLARTPCRDPRHGEIEAAYRDAARDLAEARKRQRIAGVREVRG